MGHEAPNLNRLWAGLLIEELVRCGVTRFCLSPGSRCTPLTLAVAETPGAESIMHFDERGAAFYALGHARATGRPAALVCTSGTAAANYLPAVVEASNANVPMVVLTADRPPELLDTGANQTIDQIGLYGSHARWEAALPCPDDAVPPEMVLTTVDQAVYRALRAPAGPVHLNCPFREPLVSTGAGVDFRTGGPSIAGWAKSTKPYTAYERPLVMPNEAALGDIATRLNGATRGLVVIGQLRAQADADAALELGRALGWPVLPDVASGLRLGTTAPVLAHHYDLLLLSESFRQSAAPDVVLHIGGPVTSKRLAQHLAAARPGAYIRVADHPKRVDPSHQVTLRVEADIAPFCEAVAPLVRECQDTDWLDLFAGGSQRLDALIEESLNGLSSFSEPGVARLVSRLIPEGHALLLGNSMPIRDMDMFGATDGHRIPVVANRGASGIDGLIATAAGYADGSGKPVTAVIGDLSALHDLNSLALLKKTTAPVTLVIINNDGGGIFHFLPVEKRADVFEDYFATPHGLRFEHAARMFGLGYAAPESPEAFEAAHADAARSGAPGIIEVRTCRKENQKTHQELQETLARLGSS
jgi:2-succinyl-5-enolpyruvyl-6-hydroxy-3-cyclohexene-1-carboxylate synthase